MQSRCRSFEKVPFTNACQGFPCIAPVSQNEVIVGDWSGTLLRIQLHPFVVKNKAFVAGKVVGDMPINNTLRSLTTAPDNTMMCTVATRGNHAAVWDCRSNNVFHAIPEDGLVQSVAWLGSTNYLLLGIGDYPLSSGVMPQARLEIWKLDNNELSFVNRVALPGACVDAIAVIPDGAMQVVAFSGMKSQEQGFLSVLDASSLLPQSVFELPFSMAGRVECTEESILVCHRGAVSAIRRENGNEKWSQKVAGDSPDFAHDSDSHQLLLSTGELISTGNGRVVETLPILDDCCCVKPMPEGGFVAVSKTGIIGVWDVAP